MEYAIFRAEFETETWVNQYPTLEEAKAAARHYHEDTGIEHVVVGLHERDIAEDEHMNWDGLDVIYSTYDDEEQE